MESDKTKPREEHPHRPLEPKIEPHNGETNEEPEITHGSVELGAPWLEGGLWDSQENLMQAIDQLRRIAKDLEKYDKNSCPSDEEEMKSLFDDLEMYTSAADYFKDANDSYRAALREAEPERMCLFNKINKEQEDLLECLGSVGKYMQENVQMPDKVFVLAAKLETMCSAQASVAKCLHNMESANSQLYKLKKMHADSETSTKEKLLELNTARENAFHECKEVMDDLKIFIKKLDTLPECDWKNILRQGKDHLFSRALHEEMCPHDHETSCRRCTGCEAEWQKKKREFEELYEKYEKANKQFQIIDKKLKNYIDEVNKLEQELNIQGFALETRVRSAQKDYRWAVKIAQDFKKDKMRGLPVSWCKDVEHIMQQRKNKVAIDSRNEEQAEYMDILMECAQSLDCEEEPEPQEGGGEEMAEDAGIEINIIITDKKDELGATKGDLRRTEGISEDEVRMDQAKLKAPPLSSLENTYT